MGGRDCLFETPSHKRSSASKIKNITKGVKSSLKDKLREAHRHTPRFLFRGWNNAPEKPSGGFQDLNTPDAVTPLAYLNKDPSTVKSIFKQTESDLTDMILTHLTVRARDDSKPPTQFSSWASTISIAFSFTRGRNPYIGVLDLDLLPDDPFVAHVPSLDFLDKNCPTYNWEYLLHGPIGNNAYKAIPEAAFSPIEFPLGERWGASDAEAKQTLNDALTVARKYGTHFTLPVFLAMVCLKFRHQSFRSRPRDSRREIEKILAFVNRKKMRVPREWCEEQAVMVQGFVTTAWYEDVRAVGVVMRVLCLERFPVEVGKRWPGLKREEVLREGMVEMRAGDIGKGRGK